MSNFSQTQKIKKSLVSSQKGVISSQHRLASEAGISILNKGGNAVDAAIAVSFALGVVEPWMSGPGGGGYMIIKMAEEEKAKVIDFGMRSPKDLNPLDYPLSESGISSDLFPWRSVVDNKNVTGASSVAVPGQVDGMRLAYENYGTRQWESLLAPSIGLAEEGLLVDWYAQLMIASTAEDLDKFPKSREIFFTPSGYPKSSAWTAVRQERCSLETMAEFLKELSQSGPRDFYEGNIARKIVHDIQDAGGCLSKDDLKSYHAKMYDSLEFNYGDYHLFLTPKMTAGPSMAMALNKLSQLTLSPSYPGADTYLAYAKALSETYQYRLENLGDSKEDKLESCTTHFNVVDREGNMVAVTQTLLSVFGSKLALPSTGILMNNGIMWFDPEPGKPNSIAPDKRCLSNMCPVIGQNAEKMFALGAAGGRKIFPAVMQITSFLADYNMSLEEAFHTPRIDVSNTEMAIVDSLLADDTHRCLSSQFKVVTAPRTVYPYNFACPSAVARIGSENQGMTEIMSVWSDSAAESSH